MAIIHNLGFPRIGARRELKFALEKYWKGESALAELTATAAELRGRHWQLQKNLDYVPVGDFSFYDHVLDTSFLMGNIPERAQAFKGEALDNYFRVARGRTAEAACCQGIHAGEMTKWFDTNYHYIVPEFSATTQFSLHSDALIAQIREAKVLGVKPKPVLLGPVTYLWLGKEKDASNKLDHLPALLTVYTDLLKQFAAEGVEWVQIDEPILVTELSPEWRQALNKAYHGLQSAQRSGDIKLLLATYFGQLEDNLQLACELPVAGLHIDAINAQNEVAKVVDWLPNHKILSVGAINGRNIWKTDINATLEWLLPLAEKLQDRLWLAPSCSLLHVPVDLDQEEALDSEVKQWMAFATQKLHELSLLADAINHGHNKVAEALKANAHAIEQRRHSKRVHVDAVQHALKQINDSLGKRQSAFAERAQLQHKKYNLPLYPTTTIGSFPQTQEIRQARLHYKRGELDNQHYEGKMKEHIAYAIDVQEKLGLDVLVHGEAERNDMVEYFGEQLEGYVFSQYGWVQSYGSRCVKPPIIYGDISRPKAMTVAWIQYAQSLTKKPVKGMLTGPVTILNWSFVRDDQPRKATCQQLALAIREEVQDLEKAGVNIIQIDEAALREGLPLRQSQWKDYLDWSVNAFRIAANGVKDDTQIHTHMCYSEFNDIIESIAAMDADVITIETSRSDMELLDAFDNFNYPNDIGPGVYDIHSPNIPTVEHIVQLMEKAAQRIPKERLWINPDCGLKTRRWEEVLPALENMVTAAKHLREQP